MRSEHAEARDDCREGGMTAALKPLSLLRTATGEPSLGRNAEFFTDDQGEIFAHDNPRHRSSLTRIGVLELEGGNWLAMPPGCFVAVRQDGDRLLANTLSCLLVWIDPQQARLCRLNSQSRWSKEQWLNSPKRDVMQPR